MVTTLTVTTYLPGLDLQSNTDETSIVETTSTGSLLHSNNTK